MTETTLSFAERQIRIQYPEDTQDTIDFLFRAVRQTPGKLPCATIEAIGNCCTEAFSLRKDGKQLATARNEPEMANLLMGECIHSLIEGSSTGLALHAGAVTRNGKGIWLPGKTGAGKSTLTAWLLSHGFDYLTDELVYTTGENSRFESFTRPLNIKQHGKAAIESILNLEIHKNDLLESDSVIMIPHELFDALSSKENPNLSLIIFPRYTDSAPLSIQALSPAQAGLHLMACHVNARNLPEHGFRDLAEIVRNVPCCTVDYGHLDQLQGVLDELIEITLDWNLDQKRFRKLIDMVSIGNTNHRKDLVAAPTTQEKKTYPIPAATPEGERKKLTIGMATYDDYDGTYFSVQAIRMYHPEILDEVEILVIDNNPEGPCAHSLKKIENAAKNYRYIPSNDVTSTAVRDLVFRESNADYVLCMDSHVFIAPGALRKLIDYFDSHPDSPNLLQGPMYYDDLSNLSTHFDPMWNGGMFGTWCTDERGIDPEANDFEIPMQGLGLFACRHDAWPGFHPDFRGFGGEEGYIHEKFRQQGGKTLCLPFLRWLHRFDRPMGVPYQVKWEDRIRNYFLGFRELGLDTEPIREHFTKHIGEGQTADIFCRVEEEFAKKNT